MAARRMTSVERARIFKALSDPRRVELLDLVAKHGSLCGTELANMLGISLALVSHHWDVLAEVGLLEKTRVGQTKFCTAHLASLGEAVLCWSECATSLVPSASSATGVAKTAGRKKVGAVRKGSVKKGEDEGG